MRSGKRYLTENASVRGTDKPSVELILIARHLHAAAAVRQTHTIVLVKCSVWLTRTFSPAAETLCVRRESRDFNRGVGCKCMMVTIISQTFASPSYTHRVEHIYTVFRRITLSV